MSSCNPSRTSTKICYTPTHLAYDISRPFENADQKLRDTSKMIPFIGPIALCPVRAVVSIAQIIIGLAMDIFLLPFCDFQGICSSKNKLGLLLFPLHGALNLVDSITQALSLGLLRHVI